jgi:acyl-CoA thioesterase I
MQNLIKISLLVAAFLTFNACQNDKTKAVADTNKPTTTTATETQQVEKKTILFFGNSLTAAYGLDPQQGFVHLLQQRMDSLKMPYKCINAGLSGETTAAGKERVDWVLRQKVAIFVLELGGNDALRGLSTSESYKNLQGILDQVKAKYPDCKLVLSGMMAPPNLGKKYTDEFKNNYTKLAKENNLTFIPFLLEGVGGVKSLNQADGIHPTAEGNKIITETIWKTLKTVL